MLYALRLDVMLTQYDCPCDDCSSSFTSTETPRVWNEMIALIGVSITKVAAFEIRLGHISILNDGEWHVALYHQHRRPPYWRVLLSNDTCCS